MPIDGGRDHLPGRIRKLDPGADGVVLQSLHTLAEGLSGAQGPCSPHPGNRSTKDCVTARLIAWCDRLARRTDTTADPMGHRPMAVNQATVEPATVEPATVEPATVEPATVEQIAERSRIWAGDRAARLHELLHPTLFTRPAPSGRIP